jgi:hypothetical protein
MAPASYWGKSAAWSLNRPRPIRVAASGDGSVRPGAANTYGFFVNCTKSYFLAGTTNCGIR